MKSFRSQLLVTMIIASSIVLLAMTPAQQSKPEPTPEAEAVKSAIALWDHFLRTHLQLGDGVGKVRSVMEGRSLDSGRVNLGGTGSYSLRFKVDDFLQIDVNFDGSDEVVSFRTVSKREYWLKDPASNIVHSTPKQKEL